jgi:hypothetical protein
VPATEDLTALAEAGYLPTDLSADQRLVTLHKLAQSQFQQVWYGDTVLEATTTDQQVVPAQAFVEQFGDRRAGEQLRLIAHTSRCGSTLLANLLNLRPSTMVLKEPDFVTVPARRIVLTDSVAEAHHADTLLRALLNFSCHAAAAGGRELVIKLTSWTTPVVLTVLSGSTDISWLFLWREPAKVVASNLATHPSWGKDTDDGRAARHLVGLPDTAAGTAEFYARTWRRAVLSFLSAKQELRWRSVEYEQLAVDKATALLAAEDWFDLSPITELPDGFDQESTRYSKGSGRETFEPTGTHLRNQLAQSDAAQVSAITEQALVELREQQHHRLF